MPRFWRKVLAAALVNLGLALVLLWTLFPVFWLFLTSIKSEADAFVYPPKLVFTPTFDAYYKVFSDETGSNWPRFWLNSTSVALLSTLIALLIGVPAAYGLTRFQFKNSRATLFSILSVRFMPPIVVVIPLLFMMRTLKLVDNILGLSFIHAVFALPFIIWIMLGFFASVPRDLADAALVDGTSELGALFRVVLPVVRPGLIAAALFAMLLSWNEFPIALVLTGEAAKTIPVAATTLIAERTIHWDRVAATGMIAIIPTVLFALLIQRHLIRGLAAGIVK
ncbi:MAG: carbohydrate ABC transporter permease [Anaerolineae bacterium]|nr:carbohydrate ABC transporter permease [Anaerolineae bacterium]